MKLIKPWGLNRGFTVCLFLIHPDQAAITADKREVFAADNQVDAPREGSWVAIEITTFFSPAHFYAIFPFGTKPIIDAITADSDVGEGKSSAGFSQ